MSPRNGSKETTGASTKTFDDLLGPAAGRFFGGGFRRVGHSVEDVRTTIRADEVDEYELQALGAALYPLDWSLDASGVPREVHLSSFDALAFSGAALAVAASVCEPIHRFLLASVKQVRVRAPARPVLSTRNVNVLGRIWLNREGAWQASMRVGGFSVDLTVGGRNCRLGGVDQQIHQEWLTDPFLLGTLDSVGSQSVSTSQGVQVPERALTCLEEMAMFGQLCQIAVYVTKSAGREDIPNLWIRRLRLQRSPIPPSGRILAKTTIVRDRLLRVGEAAVVDLGITARTNYGASVEADFGYRL